MRLLRFVKRFAGRHQKAHEEENSPRGQPTNLDPDGHAAIAPTMMNAKAAKSAKAATPTAAAFAVSAAFAFDPLCRRGVKARELSLRSDAQPSKGDVRTV